MRHKKAILATCSNCGVSVKHYLYQGFKLWSKWADSSSSSVSYRYVMPEVIVS